MDRVQDAKKLLTLEAQAVARCAEKLDQSFDQAIELIQKATDQNKKLIFLGVGKSHYIAAKLAASFASTGVTSLFLHPAEALHGDLGSIQAGDICVLFSKTGGTEEILVLLKWLKGRNPTIAITGNMDSQLAQKVDVALDASVEKEACPINLLPTASTTVALALGDALLSVFARESGFSKELFADYHPGGSIGKRLNKSVRQVLKLPDQVAHGPETLSLKEVAVKMGEFPLGAFCVLGSDNKMSGIIVEGDMRRAVAREQNMSETAQSLMNRNFVKLDPDMIIDEALSVMENPFPDKPEKKIYYAPVVSAEGEFLGLVHMHDLI